MPTEIRTRYRGGCYVATAQGCKRTARNTIARWAAESLARKLGLDPAWLREVRRDLTRGEVELFVHPHALEGGESWVK